jgi:sulfur-carrier protein adenylyltransferase/sulfurtransferase
LQQPPTIELNEAAPLLDGDTVFLDVREPNEWNLGHVPGAVHVPRADVETRVPAELPDRSKRIVVYCARGNRSRLAGQTLQQLGYERVENLIEGFMGWEEAGLPTVVPSTLGEEQRRRYSRHLLIPEVSEAGQRRLLESRILLIGAGGLGSPASLYLAAAGVGTIGIVDDDVVDDTNLQRQIVHSLDRLGRPKVESARETIAALNPDVTVKAFQERISSENVDRILAEGWDVIVDGADNFPTRYLVNDASVWHGIPVVHGSIYRFEGQVTVFSPGGTARGAAIQDARASHVHPSALTGRHDGGDRADLGGPCYRCLFPTPPPPELAPSCAEGGVLGVLPGVIGSLQTNEALKLVLGIGEPLVGRLLLFDALTTSFTEVALRRDPNCPVCGENPTITEYVDYVEFCSGVHA